MPCLPRAAFCASPAASLPPVPLPRVRASPTSRRWLCRLKATLTTFATGASCLYATNWPPHSPPPDALATLQPRLPVQATTPTASEAAPGRAPPPSPFPADKVASPPQSARASGPLPRRAAARRRHGAPSIQRSWQWGDAGAPGWPVCTVRRERRAVRVDHQFEFAVFSMHRSANLARLGFLQPMRKHVERPVLPPTQTHPTLRPLPHGRVVVIGGVHPSPLDQPLKRRWSESSPTPLHAPCLPSPTRPPPHPMERSLDQLGRIKVACTRPTTRNQPRLPRRRRRSWQPSPCRLLCDRVGLTPRRWWPWRDAISVCREDGISWVIRKHLVLPGQSFVLDDVLLEVRPVWRGHPWRGRRARAARPGRTPWLSCQLDLSLLGVGWTSVNLCSSLALLVERIVLLVTAPRFYSADVQTCTVQGACVHTRVHFLNACGPV